MQMYELHHPVQEVKWFLVLLIIVGWGLPAASTFYSGRTKWRR